MIEFHLDGRSPVATYKQLVQQVRQALRVGLLDTATSSPGSEAPSRWRFKPNTGLKA